MKLCAGGDPPPSPDRDEIFSSRSAVLQFSKVASSQSHYSPICIEFCTRTLTKRWRGQEKDLVKNQVKDPGNPVRQWKHLAKDQVLAFRAGPPTRSFSGVEASAEGSAEASAEVENEKPSKSGKSGKAKADLVATI
ncbi:hypothetical protein NECAME_16838 [Necator americanus]|uniref:Uncharacterized protein n=1 Tax=Necator americanus TaxID=51031 RepID=W2TUH9_NECAM|nr:hypothetical protein NECAME_16838 [Necator americanus]ETN85274.1 hypothetical protein NECAME_16838 [Necator americanus]